MKLSVEFPSVSYREGPEAVMRLARAIERIGYDHIDVFDHVVMGIPIEGRPKGPYNPAMPILEAFMTLAYLAAATSRVTLGTEVLVLPQRQPALVAKQVSTLDTLSGGRVRLGVGGGWQESEYEALGEDFRTRGKRMDDAIRLLRAYWGDAEVSFESAHYRTTAMSMEPKPPQGRRLPIRIGGASRVEDEAGARRAIGTIRRHAEEAGRDPGAIGLQSMVAPPPRDAAGKRFYAEPDRVVARVAAIHAMSFEWATLNATAIFQSGARSVAAMIDALATLHT